MGDVGPIEMWFENKWGYLKARSYYISLVTARGPKPPDRGYLKRAFGKALFRWSHEAAQLTRRSSNQKKELVHCVNKFRKPK